VVGQQVGDGGEIGLAPDETGQGRRQGGLLDRAAQDAQVQAAQLRGRVDAQLVGQGAAALLEHRQRVGGAAGGLQQPHQDAPEALVERAQPYQGKCLGR